MRWAGLISSVLLTALLTACSRPTFPPDLFNRNIPSETGSAESSQRPQRQEPAPTPPGIQGEVLVRFHLFDGPAGFRLPEHRKTLGPGAQVIVGPGEVDLDVMVPGLPEATVRRSVRVEGAPLRAQAQWLNEGGLTLPIASGKAGDRITVSVRLSESAVYFVTLLRAAPATVSVDQRFQDEWRPITVLNSFTAPGSAEIRLVFSKPVRKDEVEKALTEGQPTPVRGRISWLDERTVVWLIPSLPPRLDFLLGGARDMDGLPLPGGIPSLRIGDPPTFAEVDLRTGAERQIAVLPPDLVSAELVPGGTSVNFTAWRPGTNRWDWTTVDFYLNLADKALKTGHLGGLQPRVPSDLEHWVMNPQGTLVAGLRTERRQEVSAAALSADLIVLDLRSGRQAVVPKFIGRYVSGSAGDVTTHLGWSADGSRVAALSYKGDLKQADLITYDMLSGTRLVQAVDLPVPAFSSRISWSYDGRWILVGNLMLDLQTDRRLPLPGAAPEVRGQWAKTGARLLYSVKDWDELYLVDPASPDLLPLGQGFLVDWSGPGSAYLIRWPASGTRYSTPGL